MVLAVIGGSAGCTDASFVEKLTVSNGTDYPANVRVSDPSRQRWVNLTSAQPNQQTTVGSVIDQGAVWVFRFDYAGKHDEEVEMSRGDLARAEWTVEVPESFGAALQNLGIPPPR